MAPEQLLGEEVDRRTDLYAAGAVLYECVTGGFVYDAPTIPALIAKHIEGKPPDPRDVNSEVPEHLAQIILKALAKEPDKRWQSATEMHEALDQVQVGTQEVGAA